VIRACEVKDADEAEADQEEPSVAAAGPEVERVAAAVRDS